MTKFLLAASLFTLFFTNTDGSAQLFQGLGLCLLIGSSFSAVVHHEVRREAVSNGEFILFSLVALSMCIGLISLDTRVSLYSILFGFAFLSVSILRRSLAPDEILGTFAYAFCLSIAAALMGGLLDFLNAFVSFTSAADRFSPLDLHPNLTGFIYGSGVFILTAHAKNKPNPIKIFYCVMALICLAFVVAASSRAGLLAVVSTILFIQLAKLNSRTIKHIIGLTCFVVCLSILFAGELEQYLSSLSRYLETILALSDPNRGLNSGGTGRIHLWQRSLEELNQRPFADVLFGSGIRSSSAEFIGYSTESSYFTLALENGLVLSAVFVSSAVLAVFTTARKNPLFASILCFALIQSVFNRYLLAIGNPTSVFLLFIYSSCLLATPRTRSTKRKVSRYG